MSQDKIFDKYFKSLSINEEVLQQIPKEYFTEINLQKILATHPDRLEKIISLIQDKKLLLKVIDYIGFSSFLSGSSELIEVLKNLTYDTKYQTKLEKKIQDKHYLDSVERLRNGMITEIPSSLSENASIEALQQSLEITQNALKFFPKKYITKEFLTELIRKYPMVLEVVKEIIEDKETLIDIVCTIGIGNILSEDFKLFKILQSLTDKTEFHIQLNQKIAEIDHLVVTENTGLLDPEVFDGFHVYTAKRQNKGKFIHVDKEDLNEFMEVWNNKNITKHDMKLIFLGHCSQYANLLADMNAQQMSQFIQSQPAINSVVLQGCNTVASLPLDKEIKMQELYKKSLEDDKPFIFKLSAKNLDITSPNIIKKLKKVNSPIVYVLQESKEIGKYNLLYIDKEKKNESFIQLHTLTQEQVNFIIEKMKNKKIKFPTKNLVDYVIASNMPHELSLTNKIIQEIINPDLIKNPPKKTYPFLSSMELESHEEDKLQDSLLKKLVTELKSELKNTKREILIKGYPGKLQVDTQEGKFHVTENNVYKRDYNKQLFFSKEENINRTKLKKEQEIKIEEMKKGTAKKTLAKGIKIHINKI